MDAPYVCLICGQRPQLTEEGEPLEDVYFYQRIDGKLTLCDKEIIKGKLMYAVHGECEKKNGRL